MKEAINRAVDGLGGIARVVKAGDKILVKPNFNTADPSRLKRPRIRR